MIILPNFNRPGVWRAVFPLSNVRTRLFCVQHVSVAESRSQGSPDWRGGCHGVSATSRHPPARIVCHDGNLDLLVAPPYPLSKRLVELLSEMPIILQGELLYTVKFYPK